MGKKRIQLLLLLNSFPGLELVRDNSNHEYVLLKDSYGGKENLDNIKDKTAFEATNNHFHLLDKLSQDELSQLLQPCEKLCEIVLDYLCGLFTNKHFYVFMTASHNDSLILRFHQCWEDELPYYSERQTTNEWIISRKK